MTIYVGDDGGSSCGAGGVDGDDVGLEIKLTGHTVRSIKEKAGTECKCYRP